MENASKALLIAGAILIVIVLISVGMLIVNSTQDMTERAATTSTSQAMQVFNQQFTQYEGTQKGSTVKTLIQTVTASNGAETAAGSEHSVTINYGTGLSSSAIVNSLRYTITLTDSDNDGYIDTIAINQA